MTTDQLFSMFAASAWRLETLAAYGTADTDPGFAGWLALDGRLPPLAERPSKQQWMARVQAAAAQGRRMGRVHVLQRPLSPYRAYELATYPENQAAGEDVRIADADAHPELLALLGRDFWLLDDRLAVLMSYDALGRFRQALTTEDPALVERCRTHRRLALAAAVPLEDFLAAA